MRVAIDGEFGIRLEDCLYITPAGAKFFTQPSPAIDQPPELRGWCVDTVTVQNGILVRVRLRDCVVGEDGTKLFQALWLIAQGSSEQRRPFFGDTVKVSAKDRMDAIQTLLDRGFGKASQTVALTGGEGGPFVVRWMSGHDEE